MTSSKTSIRNKLLYWLARRDHSRRELQTKLLQRGFSREEIELGIQEIIQQGWQSDARFAELYVRKRTAAGYGPIRIQQELQQHGISEELIANHLNFDFDFWHPILMGIVSRWRTVADQQEKARRFRYLIRRGFETSWARKLVLRSPHDTDDNE